MLIRRKPLYFYYYFFFKIFFKNYFRKLFSNSIESGGGIKHRRTIKSENFILNQFENEKIVSRLVEILEMDSNSLKMASFEILTRIASAATKSMILDSAGIRGSNYEPWNLNIENLTLEKIKV